MWSHFHVFVIINAGINDNFKSFQAGTKDFKRSVEKRRFTGHFNLSATQHRRIHTQGSRDFYLLMAQLCQIAWNPQALWFLVSGIDIVVITWLSYIIKR